jgi:hypothetical protein
MLSLEFWPLHRNFFIFFKELSWTRDRNNPTKTNGLLQTPKLHMLKDGVHILCLSPNDQDSSGHYMQNASIIEKVSQMRENWRGFFKHNQQSLTNLISAFPIESTKVLILE